MTFDTQLHLSSFLLVGIVLFVTLLLPFALISCLSGTAHLPFIASDTCGSTSDCEGQHTLSSSTASHFGKVRALFTTSSILLGFLFLSFIFFRTSFSIALHHAFLDRYFSLFAWYASYVSRALVKLFSYLERLHHKGAFAFFPLSELSIA